MGFFIIQNFGEPTTYHHLHDGLRSLEKLLSDKPCWEWEMVAKCLAHKLRARVLQHLYEVEYGGRR